jgi:pyrimidine-specific ribonucleoside hydrolase
MALIFLFLALWTFPLNGHSTKARFHILIDTDAAPDDLRAICLFLASPEFEILDITTSDGALSPEDGLLKVRALLKSLGHEGIPTALGKAVQKEAPSWRDFCQGIRWGDEKNIQIQDKMKAGDLILDALENEPEPVIVVCLGALTNIGQAIEANPQIKDKVSRIAWYNDSIDPFSGTNYDIDRKAAHDVISAGIPLEVVSNSGENAYVFDARILKSIEAVPSPYAERIVSAHDDKDVWRRIESGHLRLWDDLLPVYLLYPDIFECKISDEAGRLKLCIARSLEEVQTGFLEILRSRDNVKSLVFTGFPDSPELFADDVRPYMDRIIKKHGKEEWRVGVLTNEIHGHLGIYSIIGAKMGLRARQHFNIGVDDISVVSFAGSTPPLSCMNDGLQVSTGGTIGHGLFAVSPELPYRPEATFAFKGRTVRIRLKDHYWDIVKRDIQKGVELYGSGTEENWKYVRRLALRYWLEWDRREIFSLEKDN